MDATLNQQRVVDDRRRDKMRKDTPLTKREIKKAALMYTISTICQFDQGGADNDEQIAVMTEVTSQAWSQRFKHFPDLELLPNTMQGCIDAIKGMRE